MGKDIEVPVLRMELTGIKYQVMSMVETRNGEMQMAIESGITLAYQQLPPMVAERVRAGILNAATEATCEAMKEYFGPGGRGYQRIMADIIEQLEGKEVGGPQPNLGLARYVVGPEQEKDYRLIRDRLTLEEAFQSRGKEGWFIWKAEEGKPWEKMYFWDQKSRMETGIWSMVPPQEQR